jgi:hypothetical protein
MAKEAIAYPELPHDGTATRAEFWRAAWLRALAEQEIFDRRVVNAGSWSRKPRTLQMALISARDHMRARVFNAFNELRDAGGLLFAWVPDAKGGAR